MLEPNEDRNPDALPSPSGGSLSFHGSPPEWDRDRTVLVSELTDEVRVELQPKPWGEDVEDSSDKYPFPFFPAPLDAGGNVKWQMNEEEDFKNSVTQWLVPEAFGKEGYKSKADAAQRLWDDRCRRKIEHWLTTEGAVPGTYRLDLTPAAGDVELVERVFRTENVFPDLQLVHLPDGRQTILPATAAFPVARSEGSSSSIELIIGGGIKGKGKGRA